MFNWNQGVIKICIKEKGLQSRDALDSIEYFKLDID